MYHSTQEKDTVGRIKTLQVELTAPFTVRSRLSNIYFQQSGDRIRFGVYNDPKIDYNNSSHCKVEIYCFCDLFNSIIIFLVYNFGIVLTCFFFVLFLCGFVIFLL